MASQSIIATSGMEEISLIPEYQHQEGGANIVKL
jgi:hypothetical protein